MAEMGHPHKIKNLLTCLLTYLLAHLLTNLLTYLLTYLYGDFIKESTEENAIIIIMSLKVAFQHVSIMSCISTCFNLPFFLTIIIHKPVHPGSVPLTQRPSDGYQGY